MKVLLLSILVFSTQSFAKNERRILENYDHSSIRNVEDLYASKTKQIWPGVDSDVVLTKTKQIWPGIAKLKKEIEKMKSKKIQEMALVLSAVLDELGITIHDLESAKEQ